MPHSLVKRGHMQIAEQGFFPRFPNYDKEHKAGVTGQQSMFTPA